MVDARSGKTCYFKIVLIRIASFLDLFIFFRTGFCEHWGNSSYYTLFFYIRMLFFPAQAEYSYLSADFRLKIFLYYS